MAATLANGSVSCAIVDDSTMFRALVEKVLWASIFWLLSAALGGAKVRQLSPC